MVRTGGEAIGICASHKMHEKFLKEGGGESRRNSFGERISASDKPENLVLREEALADARRAWLPARDEGCLFRYRTLYRTP